MAEIVSVTEKALKDVAIRRNYFKLSLERHVPVMKEVLRCLGIELEENAVHDDLEELFRQTAAVGITHGRVTMRLPKGVPMSHVLKKLDSKGILPDGVEETYVAGKLDGETACALVKSGALDGKGAEGEVELRILPCAADYEERVSNGGLWLEPVGLFHNEDQKRQQELFEEYQKSFSALDVQYADPMELAISMMCDRVAGVNPKDNDTTFSKGWYRTLIEVTGGDGRRRLCMGSDDGRFWLWWYGHLDAGSGDAVVASVGIKR